MAKHCNSDIVKYFVYFVGWYLEAIRRSSEAA
jgi:hypothetical protein